jgi:SH3 domain-containing protein 19
VIERVSDEWLRGEIYGRRGIFPINYVQLDDIYSIPMEQKSISSATLTGTFEVPQVTVTAIYDYDSGVADDLRFKIGDVIEVVKYVNDEWIMGKLYGKTGLVPLTFVQHN